MGLEIERKFLVPGAFPQGSMQHIIKQGYVNPKLGSVGLDGGFLVFFNRANKELYRVNVGADAAGILKDISNANGKLLLDDKNVVRIRIRDNESFITIKGKISSAGTPEYEYMIPSNVANMLMDNLVDSYLSKVRHIIPQGDKKWEVDEFISPIQLVLAEIELSSPGEEVEIPAWVGKEVTGDRRYFNSEIIKMKQSSSDFVQQFMGL